MSRANEERRERAREARVAAEREMQLQERRRRRLWQLGAVVAVAVAVVVIAVVLSSSGGSTAKVQAGKPVPHAGVVADEFRGVPQHGINLGSPSAPVTFVEFGDLKCPICRDFNTAVFPTLLDRYVKTGKVRMVYRVQHFVGEQLNPGDSTAAARFALAAAQQNRMWPFVELFYENQQDESTRYVSDAFLRHLGSAVPGLNVSKALAARNSPPVNAQLSAAGTLFDQYGFTGTPSFLIGGKGHPLAPLNYNDPGQLSDFTGPIDKLLKG